MQDTQKGSGLGIIGWDLFEYVVEDLDKARRFYEEKMDVHGRARLDERSADRFGEDALLLRAGSADFACVASRMEGSRADRWLKRHPEGVAVLALRVRDLDAAHRTLEARGATFTTPVASEKDGEDGPYRHFEIASPLGDVRFRFTEHATGALPPGFAPVEAPGDGNRYHLQVIDHVTSNMLTLKPYIDWLKDVLGFEEYWRIKFHTSDVKGEDGGSGLFSTVMWDPESKVKLANNEPLNPNYEASQIYTFVEDNKGPGVQHIAFHLPDIIGAVDGMRRTGIEFLNTPGAYYDMLPGRLKESQVTNFNEDMDVLRKLGILVDGADDRYLLQIFSVEGRLLQDTEQGGPFFYELIQRKGARGFGGGNFRALFEAIERDQETRGVTASKPNPWSGS